MYMYMFISTIIILDVAKGDSLVRHQKKTFNILSLFSNEISNGHIYRIIIIFCDVSIKFQNY